MGGKPKAHLIYDASEDQKKCEWFIAVLDQIKREASQQNLTPVALDLISAPASEAYVERVLSVCGDLCSGKRNHMCKNLEQRAFLRMTNHLLVRA